MVSARVNVILFSLGSFLIGLVIGVDLYGSTFYFDHAEFSLNKTLNVASETAGIVYGLIGGIGIILIGIGYLNTFRRR